MAGNGCRPAGSGRTAWNAGVAWPSRLGRAGPGRPWAGAPSQAVAFSLRSVTQAENGRGPVVPMGRPSTNRKNVFGFSLLFEKRNTLENVCVLILAPNLLKQILLCSLSPDLHDKNIACHF